MGSRSKTGNKKKKLEQKMSSTANLILNMPNNCKICHEPFDKKNKLMIMTWFVEVFSKEKRVDLYCPKCNESRKTDEISRNTGV